MLFVFVLLGYPFIALLLLMLYCFHGKARPYYFNLIRTANMLLWLFLVIGLFAIIVLNLLVSLFQGVFIKGLLWDSIDAILVKLSIPYMLIVVSFFFKRIRREAVWTALSFALLTSFPLLSGIFLNTGPLYNMALSALFFLLVTIAVTHVKMSTKKTIARENNDRLPDRI